MLEEKALSHEESNTVKSNAMKGLSFGMTAEVQHTHTHTHSCTHTHTHSCTHTHRRK